ncbi:substrate-binding domain-containing protein [Nonomuraea wenchangensis]|uniref:Ribose transport system substrate-binding protein n=1 Tax=Nonomuraea wenchangensis TaxID=568860 RepID=A0A1I0LAL4_9ACTN|nr:substrate-binding domain-containing protein [Nonomuraea wenchangensis]SEU36478.1 ribose transport system substrate-binding protein [Nonomuraea wenchangensis]
MSSTRARFRARGSAAVLALALGATACAGGPGASNNATEGGGVEAVYDNAAKIGDVSQLRPMSEFCGTKPVKVALADGTGDNAFRKTARAEFEDEAAKCPNITVLPYADGQNNPQKAISDIKALVAQGVEALVVFPDAGEALLPTLREAYKAGVQVVPWTANPGGKPGVDYTSFVGHNTVNDGVTWTRWMCEALGEKGGNVVFLGGTPGNTQSITEMVGIEKELKENSACANVKLLNEPGKPVDTNWNPAQMQKVVAGLLTKYPTIDGVITDSGDASLGGIRAFLQAGRPLPKWTANDNNGFACAWKEHADKNPTFQTVTVSARTWIIRLALRKAVAAHQGIKNDEPEIINIPIFENTLDETKPPKCDTDLPASAVLSSELTPEQLKQAYS